MKKIIIYTMMMFILLSSVIAFEWGTVGSGYFRQPEVGGTFDIDDSFDLVNFTCGTSAFENPQPIYDFISSSQKATSMLCLADSTSAHQHLIILDHTLSEIGDIDIVPTFVAETDPTTRPRYFSNYQYNNGSEVLYYNVVIYQEDSLDDVEVQFIRYDEDTSNLVKDNSYLLFNGTSINPSGDIFIDCNEEVGGDYEQDYTANNDCYLHIENNTDMYWIKFNYSGIIYTEKGYPVSKNFISGDVNLYPLYGIMDNSNGAFEWCNLYSGDHEVYCIYADNGSVSRNMNLSVSGEAGYWSLINTTESGGEASRMEFLVTSSDDVGGDFLYGKIFDTLDGSNVQENAVEVSNSGAKVYGISWIEDVENVNEAELCVYAEDRSSGASSSRLRCEELNAFQSETIDIVSRFDSDGEAILLTTTYRNVLIDQDNDGRLELIGGKGIIDFNDNGTYITSTHLFQDYAANSTTDELNFIVADLFNTGDTPAIIGCSGEASTDTCYIRAPIGTLTLAPEVNEQINFTLWGPDSNIAEPVCENSTIDWTCSYSNNCVNDTEQDAFAMCIDCFGDGTEIVCTEPRFEDDMNKGWYGYDETLSCDMSLNTSVSEFETIFYVWDNEGNGFEGGNVTNNNTATRTITMAASSCNNETEPGELLDRPVINTKPYFNLSPTPNVPEPICINDTTYFTCERGDCYIDPEGDLVYFYVDCEGDGTYDEVTAYNTDRFPCYFNDSSVTQISVKVCDAHHSFSICDSRTIGVVLSNYSFQNVIDEGEFLCMSGSMIDSSGNIQPLFKGANPDYSSGNSIYDTMTETSETFGIELASFGWIFIFIVTLTVFFSGLYNKVSAIGIISGVLFIVLTSLLTFMNIVSGLAIIIIVVITAAGLITIRMFNPSTGG